MVRVTDSLLPQIAADFGVTVGAASIVVTVYAAMHGSIQLVIGPIGERIGKYLAITIACGLTAVLVLLCGLTQSLPSLALARLASGATAGWIIPLAMAFVGDVTPYERRQQVLGRYLAGQISGQLSGQAAGGILGDLMGWRNVFFLLAALFALATLALALEFARNPATRKQAGSSRGARGFAADYVTVLSNPWARTLILVVGAEGALMFGAFAYVGADLHARLGFSLTEVGLSVAAFAVGGLVYVMAVTSLYAWFGQQGLARVGGLVVALAYLALVPGGPVWLIPIAIAGIGLGFYMFHNTLQTNATQMSPQARGTAVAIFSAGFYLGQTLGVAMGAPTIDRLGAPALFTFVALVFPLLAWWFATRLSKR